MAGPDWVSWLLRAPLLGALGAHLLGGFGAGARTAATGLALSMLPRAISSFSGWRVPWLAELP